MSLKKSNINKKIKKKTTSGEILGEEKLEDLGIFSDEEEMFDQENQNSNGIISEKRKKQ